MAQYLDGIQEIEDGIGEFVVIAQGTIPVAIGNQYPSTAVNKPSKIYRNHALLVQNLSTQAINNFTVTSRSDASYGFANDSSFTLFVGTTSGAIANAALGSLDMTPTKMLNPFIAGKNMFVQFNLAASPASAGTINYALIGWN